MSCEDGSCSRDSGERRSRRRQYEDDDDDEMSVGEAIGGLVGGVADAGIGIMTGLLGGFLGGGGGRRRRRRG